jgi:hypothetical protein
MHATNLSGQKFIVNPEVDISAPEAGHGIDLIFSQGYLYLESSIAESGCGLDLTSLAQKPGKYLAVRIIRRPGPR